MNSNYGRSTKSGSINSFDFDLGLNSNRSRPLNDQKNNKTSYSSSSSYSYSYSSTQPNPNTTSPWQPNKPSWTHQPAPSQSTRPGSLSGPTSMVGDITGRSWNSVTPTSTAAAGIGILNKNPNLFKDLLGPALGQNKSNTNVPLKSVTPSSNKNAYSMGNIADSLPKATSSFNSGVAWGSSVNATGYNTSSTANLGNNKSPNLGGQSMKSSSGTGFGGGMSSSNKDPFGYLVDFSSKPTTSMNTGSKPNKLHSVDDSFGDFKSSKTSTFPSNTFPANNSYSKMDVFGVPPPQAQPPVQSSGFDSFDSLFSSSTSGGGAATKETDAFAPEQFAGADEWDKEFGGGNDASGTTTELDGLPPPPAGVTFSTAKSKGMDNYKQGQYPDAIKWLSWAIVLLEKVGDKAGTMEVLSSRASCYKEVGEYKKAVADCTKVLEQDDANISVLVQRALLYESMEKYKLGAEDLRTVMKLDPGNRVARSTIHRLTKMAE